jgi:hypothetical protein
MINHWILGYPELETNPPMSQGDVGRKPRWNVLDPYLLDILFGGLYHDYDILWHEPAH